MNIYNSLDSVPQIEKAVLALGAFDGMHLAHRHLVEKVCQNARENNGNSVIISFLAHPKKIISEDFNQGVLTTQSEKTDILAEIGLDNLIITDFTTEISAMTYIDFIDFLQKKIDIQKIILGYNHHFGKNREGCYATLSELGKQRRFEVEEIEKQTIHGLDISSSSIRSALKCGDIETANKLLGYRYAINIQTLYEKNTQQNEFFFNQNKILPKNGRYTVKIDECNFVLTVNYPHLSIDAMNRETGSYKVEFVSSS
ncbi:MAG: FAD synthetase family protein [Lentimicrobiaceae bacterium]|nr:FAD synthetase family protein [Lentimicrobiaceae bacterium]